MQIEERRSKPRVAQAEKIKQIQRAREREGPLPESLVSKLDRVRENIREQWHLLLALFILWLCCFTDGAVSVWPIKVLSRSLSPFLSKIVLLLGGDVETNPGPLTGSKCMIHTHLHEHVCTPIIVIHIAYSS